MGRCLPTPGRGKALPRGDDVVTKSLRRRTAAGAVPAVMLPAVGGRPRAGGRGMRADGGSWPLGEGRGGVAAGLGSRPSTIPRTMRRQRVCAASWALRVRNSGGGYSPSRAVRAEGGGEPGLARAGSQPAPPGPRRLPRPRRRAGVHDRARRGRDGRPHGPGHHRQSCGRAGPGGSELGRVRRRARHLLRPRVRLRLSSLRERRLRLGDGVCTPTTSSGLHRRGARGNGSRSRLAARSSSRSCPGAARTLARARPASRATPTARPRRASRSCRRPPRRPARSARGLSWSADASAYEGFIGARFAYACPANGAAGSVTGTAVYTDDSSVCTAAVKEGRITLAGGGTVTIEMRPGQASYAGSTSNGVTSSSYGAWAGSFSIVSTTRTVPRSAPASTGWNVSAASVQGNAGARFLVVCPPFRNPSNVWGVRRPTPTTARCAQPRCSRDGSPSSPEAASRSSFDPARAPTTARPPTASRASRTAPGRAASRSSRRAPRAGRRAPAAPAGG